MTVPQESTVPQRISWKWVAFLSSGFLQRRDDNTQRSAYSSHFQKPIFNSTEQFAFTLHLKRTWGHRHVAPPLYLSARVIFQNGRQLLGPQAPFLARLCNNNFIFNRITSYSTKFDIFFRLSFSSEVGMLR